MAAEPIHVEADEEVPTIVERIRRSRSDEVHLVLPARARFGQSRFNFQLLKQYTTRLGKRVAIVSPDPGVQRLAEESGFGAYRLRETGIQPGGSAPPVSPAGLPGQAVGRPVPPPAPPAGAGMARPPAAITPPGMGVTPPAGNRPGPGGGFTRPAQAVPGARIRIGAPGQLPARLSLFEPARYVLYAGAALLLLAGVLATVFYVPSARVTLVAQAQSVSTPVEVAAEPNKLPVHVRVTNVRKTASIQGQATGTKITPGELAEGQFIYVNGCPETLRVPNGQRLRSVTGVVFAQLGDVDVPQGRSASAPIKAVQSGQSGNVGAGQITGIDPNPYPCLVGTNKDPTSGGTDDQKQTVIQTSDIQSARAQLEQQLWNQTLDEVNHGLQKGEKLPDQAIFITNADFNSTHKPDENYQTFTATLTLDAEADYYVTDDVDRFFAEKLRSTVRGDQQLTSDKVTVNALSVAATGGGHLNFTGQASGYVAPKLDTDKVSGQLVGKTSSQARDILGKLPVRRVDIRQSPLPLPLLPLSSSRIYIDYVIDPAAAAPKSG